MHYCNDLEFTCYFNRSQFDGAKLEILITWNPGSSEVSVNLYVVDVPNTSRSNCVASLLLYAHFRVALEVLTKKIFSLECSQENRCIICPFRKLLTPEKYIGAWRLKAGVIPLRPLILRVMEVSFPSLCHK